MKSRDEKLIDRMRANKVSEKVISRIALSWVNRTDNGRISVFEVSSEILKWLSIAVLIGLMVSTATEILPQTVVKLCSTLESTAVLYFFVFGVTTIFFGIVMININKVIESSVKASRDEVKKGVREEELDPETFYFNRNIVGNTLGRTQLARAVSAVTSILAIVGLMATGHWPVCFLLIIGLVLFSVGRSKLADYIKAMAAKPVKTPEGSVVG